MTARFGEISGSHPAFILAVYSPAFAAVAVVLYYGGFLGLKSFQSQRFRGVGTGNGYGLGVAYRPGGFFPVYNFLLAYFPELGIAVAMPINTERSNIEEHFDAIVEIIVNSVGKNRAQLPGSPTEPLSGEPLAITLDGRYVVRNDRIRANPR